MIRGLRNVCTKYDTRLPTRITESVSSQQRPSVLNPLNKMFLFYRKLLMNTDLQDHSVMQIIKIHCFTNQA